MADLPVIVLREIFDFLRVWERLRLRCICKGWKFVIETFTLSAADLQWPELNRLHEIEQEMQLIDESAQNRLRNKKLNSEPITAAYFFNERVNFFIKKILVPKFGAIAYWFRVEF